MSDKPLRRGIRTVADIRARSKVDPVSHCWVWQHAMARGRGHETDTPVMHVFDPRVNDKRVLSGPLATWIVAFGWAPPAGRYVWRCCGNTRCVNPAHLRCGTRVDLGEHMARSGRLKGLALDAKRKCVKLAQAAYAAKHGITPTSPEIVLKVRAAPAGTKGADLARRFGLSETVVSRIRRGLTHRELRARAPETHPQEAQDGPQ